MSRERFRKALLPPGLENIEKLKKIVDEGNYYGAQQMYKTTSARYTSVGRYTEALDLLQSGACLQLEHDQVTCGGELAALFVETLVKAKVDFDDDYLDRIRKIYKKFPRIPLPENLDLADDEAIHRLSETLGAAKTRVQSCSSFLKAAIKWSAEHGPRKIGSPELHDMLAEYIYSESPEADMTRVCFHFARGRNPKKFASTLVNFMGKCYPGEDDLAIARAVLMYLSIGNLRDANNIMDEIKKLARAKELEFPESELMRFIDYLLQTLMRDALPLFNMLRQKFSSCIDRDPMFNELLDDIGEKFYGVRRKNPLQGMFGDLFKM
ncbi:Golgi to ER traffic protein 4 homolog [Cynara cardunculus var. scolymus]|uniref:Golgi to ER traffic protein 4 homolog n=1 Tax=Cynara cardunculus var. scolymus TaxID=59895 RepID=UPI000D62B838|nr:Golgi to ER traffic protein 4 homolog [Cynara cardunculus var. scolymus]